MFLICATFDAREVRKSLRAKRRLKLLVLDQELELKDLWNEHHTDGELDEVLLIDVPKLQALYLTAEH
jgi:hypothetical protein